MQLTPNIRIMRFIQKNYIFVIGIVVYALIAILFFYHSPIDISRKLDSNLFRDFGTFTASLIAFFALLYNSNEYLRKKKDRRPFLFVKKTEFTTKDREIEINLTEDPDCDVETVFFENGKETRPYIELINVGYNNAIYIEVEWIFNEIRIRELLKGNYNFGLYQKSQNFDYHETINVGESIKLNLPEYWMRQNGQKLNNGEFSNWDQDKDKLKTHLLLKILYKNVDDVDFDYMFQIKSTTKLTTNVVIETVAKDALRQNRKKKR